MVEVAAAVLQRRDGAYLVAQRPKGKVYEGYWEFPGGKVEPGEQPDAALARELHEELGVEVETAYPWITRTYAYPHATVRLRFFRVTRWRGEPRPREQQAIAWQEAGTSAVAPMLPANAPVLASLALPTEYAITDAARMGSAVMLERLQRRLEQGLKLLQIREPAFQGRDLFIQQAIGRARRYDCKVMVKAALPDADGIHFTAAELMKLQSRPQGVLAAASCHTRDELKRAMHLELDFAVVGPVREKSGSMPLGWTGFQRIVEDTAIPVYAVGGLTLADLEDAWQAGAHGLAMIRGAWA